MSMFYEKQHCCCCVPLPEGVMLVGIYGTSFHVGLLSIQLAYNQATLIPSPITDVQDTTSQHASSIARHENRVNPIPFDVAGYHVTDIDQYNSDKTAHFTSSGIVDKEVVDVVYPLLLVAHVLGIVVNLLLGKIFFLSLT